MAVLVLDDDINKEIAKLILSSEGFYGYGGCSRGVVKLLIYGSKLSIA